MNEAKLEDITLSITDGKHGDCKPDDNSGYYFISCKDVHDGIIDYSNARQITKEDFCSTHRRTQLAPNDILITNSGTIGRMAFVKDTSETLRTTFQKSVAIVKPDTTKIVPAFLYYRLIACVNDFVNQSNGSAQKNLLLGTIRNFVLTYPKNMQKQEEIANALLSYDQLIENNQYQIKLLEEAAQRLYKEWFVDFRFPGHETAKFINGLPEGWRKGTLSELGQFKRGKTITKEQTVSGSVPVVAGGLEPAYYHNQSNTESPVVTVSASGANAGFTRMYFKRIWASDCSFIDCKLTENLFFMYVFLKENPNLLKNLQKGSAQPHVYPTHLNNLLLIIPAKDLLIKFCYVVTPIFSKIGTLDRQISFLQEARDRILNKVMNFEEQ